MHPVSDLQIEYSLISRSLEGDDLESNLALVERLREVAAQLGASVAQVAIAWVGAQGDDIVRLVGARTAVPKGSAAGDRYDAAHMALLDSES